MIKDVKKTIPSEEVQLAWLAGIIDGEGSIGIYNRISHKIVNLSIVNSDENILNNVIKIFTLFKIITSKYIHNYSNDKSFKKNKPCYVITVRRRCDFEKSLNLLIPYLIGKKKEKAIEALQFLQDHPVFVRPSIFCKYCKKEIKGRKKKYCDLNCWHLFATGKNNPNYRHGNNLTRND